jgi:hypothetical protein
VSLNPITKTGGDIATYVKRQFGDESGVQITDQDIFRWINAAQLQIVAKIAPIKAKATTNIVSGQRIYPFVGLAIHQIESIHYDGNFLPPKSFQQAERDIIEYPDQPDSGAPAFWYEWAGEIYLFPTPNQAITDGLEIFFTKMPSPVISSTDPLTIPDKYFEAIAAWVLSKAYELDEEFDQANNQRQFFDSQVMEQNGEELTSANSTYPVITYIGD